MVAYKALPSSLEELAEFLIGNNASHVVVGARNADERLHDALATGNARFLLGLDDPRKCAAEIIADTGAQPRAAVRAIANACPQILRLSDLPGALTLHAAESVGQAAPDTVKQIAQHMGISIDADLAGAVAAEATSLAPPVSPSSGEAGGALESRVRKMLEGALAAYDDIFRGGQIGRIVWTRELFLLVADSTAPMQPVDMSGAQGTLVFGPYLHLPPGEWSAQVVLGFSRETVGTTILIDVFSETQLACTTFQPRAPSIHVAELTFSTGQPRGLGIEIRVMVASETAAGQLAFGQVVLQPLAARLSGFAATAQDFEAVLDL